MRRQMIYFARARPSSRLRRFDISSKYMASAASSKCPQCPVMYPYPADKIRPRSFDLPFRFDQCPVATLRTDGIFSDSSSSSADATLAYLDLEKLRLCRNTSIKISTSKRFNPPITRLWQKQQRRLRPTHEEEDPYIAAVLIALAQRQRHRQGAGVEKAEEATADIPFDVGPSATPSVSEATKKTSRDATMCFKVRLLLQRWYWTLS